MKTTGTLQNFQKATKKLTKHYKELLDTPEKEKFIVVGSNNHWYAESLTYKDALDEIKILKNQVNPDPELPAIFYIYKAIELKSIKT